MRFRFDMYQAGRTPIHECDARVKIVLLIVFSISVLTVHTWWGIAVLACLLALVLGCAHVPFACINRSLVPVYVIAILSAAFNILAQPNATGLLSGLFIAARMVVLVAGSFAVCFTTPATCLVEALRSLMKPLRVIRVPVDDLAFTLSLALRFVPVIGEEAMRIRTAQEARGSLLAHGVCERFRRWGATFVSVFVGLFRRADTLASAMDARCYGATSTRTSLQNMRISLPSIVALIVGFAVLVCICVFL